MRSILLLAVTVVTLAGCIHAETTPAPRSSTTVVTPAPSDTATVIRNP